jgi:hypothetical protein
MRRVLGVIAIVVMIAIVAPAGADTESSGCTATQAATASPLIGETAPTCTFEVTCTGATTVCVYAVTLDVNGTGLVEGTMSAEVVTPDTAVLSFNHADGSGPADDPACSGALQCHYASGVDNDVLLFVGQQAGDGALIKITCAGGGLALVDNVTCGVAAVEFGPQ